MPLTAGESVFWLRNKLPFSLLSQQDNLDELQTELDKMPSGSLVN